MSTQLTQFKYFRVVLPVAVDTATAGEGFVDDRRVTDNDFLGSLPGSSVASAAINVGGTGYADGDEVRLVSDAGPGKGVLLSVLETGGILDTGTVLEAGKYQAVPAAGVAQESTDGVGINGTWDLTLTGVLAGYDKARANRRWQNVVAQLQETGSVTIMDITQTGGTEATAPTQLDFTVQYSSEQVVFMYDLVTDPTGLTVYGPTADLDLVGFPANITFTNATEELVIERAISTALARATATIQSEVYDGTRPSASEAAGFPIRFLDLTTTQLGTGATHALRMANIEAQGTFTVTKLDV